jgi:hypothetical protein
MTPRLPANFPEPSMLLGRTQKFLRPAESNSEQQPSSFLIECFSHAEGEVRPTIHL